MIQFDEFTFQMGGSNQHSQAERSQVPRFLSHNLGDPLRSESDPPRNFCTIPGIPTTIKTMGVNITTID